MTQQEGQQKGTNKTTREIPVPLPPERYSTKVPSAKVTELRPRPTRGGGKAQVF